MLKLKLSLQHTKNLIAGMTVAVAIAITMIVPTLGLAFSDNYKQIGTTEDQSITQSGETEFTFAPPDFTDNLFVPFSRSENEWDSQMLPTNPQDDIDGNYESDTNGNMIVSPELEPAVDQLETLASSEPVDLITEVDAYTLYITKNSVNMRAEPNTNCTIVAVLSMGDKLTATGETEGWKKITDSEGREGFVSAEFTSESMVFIEKNDTVYITKNGVNLRQEPTAESKSLGLLSVNTRLTRIGFGDGWTRVKTSAGETGYVATGFLTATVPASYQAGTTTDNGTSGEAETVNNSGNEIVDLAYSMLGVPYVWGSESRSGADCSGLIYYIYKQIGVTVPRSSSGYYDFGSAVTLSTMKPGDIIAMDTRRSDGKTSITHLGIYVGDGNMIHASSTKKEVVIANVNQYLSYGVKLISIRRINS